MGRVAAGEPARVRGRLAPESMFPAGHDQIRVRRTTLPSCITLRVAESGDVGAPPLLLLHGWGASVYMWRAWFAPLAAAGWRPIAVDLPGHGLSDKPEEDGAYSLPRQVALLRELLVSERLEGAPIVAQSMAGTIALELALEDGAVVGPLALINAACFGRVGILTVARLVSPPVVDFMLTRVVPRWIVSRAHRLAYADPTRITARDVDEYWAPSQFPAYARAMRRLLHDFHWHRQPADRFAARLDKLPRPPLVLLGTRDAIVRDAVPYVTALERAGATLVTHVLTEGGHAANEEDPDTVIPLVLRYLKG
jgi:pimeloyl-ACP methyl ester carboxylesterase